VTNWVGDKNPWNMLPPPEWWLRRLHDIDKDLVVLPGLTECVYRVARRSRAAAALKPIQLEGETARFGALGVVPVTSLVPWVRWDESFFQWLRDHDTWAVGGGAKAADRLEAMESEAAAKRERELRDEATQRAVSSYEALKRRAGEMVTLSQPASPLR